MKGGDDYDRLQATLTRAVAGMGGAERGRHREFLLRHQAPDGGFTGRQGGGDTYYTAFALRALAVLAPEAVEPGRRAAAFLAAHPPATVVEALQTLHARRALTGLEPPVAVDGLPEIGALLAAGRSADGGWAKRPGGPGSTYWTYLALLVHEAVGAAPPEGGELAGFLAARVRPDGGFAETPAGRRGATNATAAGVGVARRLGGAGEPYLEPARLFLEGMRQAGGGWRAGAGAPVADLLSTFTARLTLDHLGGSADEGSRPFLEGCRGPDGGFRAGPWDSAADPEYTFYGLCLLGREAAEEASHGG